LETLDVIDRKQGIISGLRCRIEMLEAEESRLKQEILFHRASIADIRKIPVELLSRIFTFIDPDPDNHCDPFNFNPLKANYPLMLVCKLWCRVIISTPRLWSRFSLHPRSGTLAHLETCIARSGGLSLDVSISFSGYASKLTHWKELRPFLGRLKSISFDPHSDYDTVFYEEEWREIFADLAKSTTRELTLSSVPFDVMNPYESCTIPSLRKVRITGPISTIPPLVLPSLEVLHIVSCGLSAQNLWDIVKMSPQLQTLDLEESWLEQRSWRAFRPETTASQTFDRLEILRFGENRRGSDTELYLPLLQRCPNLTTLDISFSERAYHFIEEVPAAHFKHLLKLTIRTRRFDSWGGEVPRIQPGGLQPLMLWLSMADKLEDLFVNTSRCSTDFDVGVVLQSLIRGDAKGVRIICPRLKSLKVHGTTNWPSLLLRLMAERSASPEELREAGYNPDLALGSSSSDQPFESEFVLTPRPSPSDSELTSMTPYRSTSVGWKQFHEDYKEFFGSSERMSRDQDHFDLTTVTRHGDSQQRLSFLCENMRKNAETFEANWAHEEHVGYIGHDLLDEVADLYGLESDEEDQPWLLDAYDDEMDVMDPGWDVYEPDFW
jgi:hypothetical protein